MQPRRGAPLSRHARRLAERAAGRLPRARGLRRRLPHQRGHPRRRARQRAAVALAARRHRPPRRLRPPLRAARPAARAGALERRTVHAIVAHFGLIHSSRVRQVERLGRVHRRRACRAASADRRRRLQRLGREARRADARLRAAPGDRPGRSGRPLQHLPVAPAAVLAGPHLRARPALRDDLGAARPAWARMSDHLPLMAELELA